MHFNHLKKDDLSIRKYKKNVLSLPILLLKLITFVRQDEDKKSGTGDGQTTEDESSQDSKGESQVSQDPAQAPGNADVDQPDITKEENKSIEGQVLTPIPLSGLCSQVGVHLHGN